MRKTSFGLSDLLQISRSQKWFTPCLWKKRGKGFHHHSRAGLTGRQKIKKLRGHPGLRVVQVM